ncbi:MAG TPA: zinc-binding dehydrogenase [Stackebrandtia sp.]|uniref:zinc-binding dehydrogenase n=1 Tax=Stackebrandtia sp. TaxID=2023065 RepID=UPI002D346D58|nr:zinc-binding dehydrogenase [Stackebrandtia sp.]HZE39011.1 zinc-binding dehydrogenase [Stackebrandtia sp.]
MNTAPTRRFARANAVGAPREVIAIATEPLEPPAPGHLVIEVEAAAINHSESLAMAGGYYAEKLEFPAPLGYEGAGVVVRAGNGTTVDVGTAVAFVAPGTGACATHVTIPESFAVARPEGMSPATAARVPSAGITARLLTRVRDDWDGASAAVWGAAGPVGRMLSGFLAESGATVCGIASGDRVCDVTAVGAAHAVDRGAGDVAAAVREATGGRGVDVVFDCVGAPTYDSSLAMLATRGLYVSFGQVSGSLPPVDLMALMERGLKVTKFGGGSAYMDGFSEFGELLSRAVTAAANRPALVSRPGGEFALDEVVAAFEALGKGAPGKIVVRP